MCCSRSCPPTQLSLDQRKSLSVRETCVLHVIHFAEQTGDKTASVAERAKNEAIKDLSLYKAFIRMHTSLVRAGVVSPISWKGSPGRGGFAQNQNSAPVES